MAGALPLGIRTHSQRVCSLYKRALRNVEAFYDRRDVYRYQAVLLRDRFNKNAKIQDMRKAVQLLKEGEEELFLQQHPIPKKFAESPGGVAYEREVEPPDWVLDYWHPLEKAQYPEYFKRREQRKKEFIAMWEKQYGKQEEKPHH
ncbi:NADH dehydrogenase [ubiquinone] 1 beta subcomplex subunit 9 [Leguminivora glycinivorella]|uniref:NADH dehydrogenase [ubiquinone] 1 beta subcomplex subunit 9 n=1 Tax=Leguminivora glycinivorella TaxID=1035111 RepID=UPI00200BBC61|nr:NADH dehydrogenase [ubiquinone] 1 beta subcomplex subunit 9 [Leguminivora glycinivorella]